MTKEYRNTSLKGTLVDLRLREQYKNKKTKGVHDRFKNHKCADNGLLGVGPYLY